MVLTEVSHICKLLGCMHITIISLLRLSIKLHLLWGTTEIFKSICIFKIQITAHENS